MTKIRLKSQRMRTITALFWEYAIKTLVNSWKKSSKGWKTVNATFPNNLMTRKPSAHAFISCPMTTYCASSGHKILKWSKTFAAASSLTTVKC